MDQEETSIKRTFERKYLEFKRDGLKSYAAYLSTQLTLSEGKDTWRAHRKYTEEQIEQTRLKLADLEERLEATH